MPRVNRRRPEPPRRPLGGTVATVRYAGRQWAVRQVHGRADDRAYRCPGCEQDLPAGLAHVVVWPVDGMSGLENRRHWHTACWQARDRRRPPGAIA